MKGFFLRLICCVLLTGAVTNSVYNQRLSKNMEGEKFENITLETSLKPFKKNNSAYILKTAADMFLEWRPLLRHADTVSILLWTADGSEILNYTGNLDQSLEWARYIGNPNTSHEVGSGPKSLSLHERAYLYMKDPPRFTYRDLKFIVASLREQGEKITGKPIRIGATFDPGPEFAKSDFKYKKHPEILEGNAMGSKSFIYSYATLHKDSVSYAGFKNGIEEGTPFGVFLGRQSQHFLSDLGFNYIWFSNGLGFGLEPWSSTGAIFTGQGFDTGKLDQVKNKILAFWRLFRKECPYYRIETRGTNLSTGIDLAKDGVDLRAIYNGGFNILPPPNSPWAALDGDFGLELTGYMSRMAELPDYRYIFRYYTHDPWWLNSPWLDRYGREPNDIYLPLSVSRIDMEGNIDLPTHLNLLTIDNSFGDMPEQVPNEVIPHLLKARYDSPTAPGPLVWVYPFDEYHNWASQHTRLSEIYYGDWFIRQAINNAFPLNTVISTKAFQKVFKIKENLFKESILVSIVPDAGSSYESALIDYVQNGGQLIVYGPADHAGSAFRKILNLRNSEPLEGEFKLAKEYCLDRTGDNAPVLINHETLLSAGGLRTKIDNEGDPYTKCLVRLEKDGQFRDEVWTRAMPTWNGGKLVYIRGTLSSHYNGGRLLVTDDVDKYFIAPVYMRYVLQEFGFRFKVMKQNRSIKDPVFTISRADNAFVFSGYTPNTTVKQSFKFPQGAPVLTGYDTQLEQGSAVYSLPPAWHREARVFVEQKGGIVGCKEMHSGELGITRRLKITGLENAVVRVFPNDCVSGNNIHFYLNAHYPWKKGKVEFAKGESKFGNNFKVENVSGDLVVSW